MHRRRQNSQNGRKSATVSIFCWWGIAVKKISQIVHARICWILEEIHFEVKVYCTREAWRRSSLISHSTRHVSCNFITFLVMCVYYLCTHPFLLGFRKVLLAHIRYEKLSIRKKISSEKTIIWGKFFTRGIFSAFPTIR